MPVQLIDPIDGPILSELPKQGTLVGGLRPLAVTVKAIRGRIEAKFGREVALASSEIQTRLRLMNAAGLVVKVKTMGTGGAAGWQITPAGEQELARIREEANQ